MQNIAKKISNTLFLSSLFLLIALVTILIFSSVLFIFNMDIVGFFSIISILLSFFIYYFVTIKKGQFSKLEIVLGNILAVILIILAIILSTQIYDFAWDSNWYHKSALGCLKLGWNPVYQAFEEFIPKTDMAVGCLKSAKIWVDHYCKASWIVGANIYSLTNNIETAKAINLIMIFILFVLVFVGIMVGVIYVETAERRIPIQYANKSTSMLGKQNYIPFKLNSSGVMPVIFASALLSIPQILASVIKNEGFTLFVQKYLNYTTGVGFGIYIVLILAFAYFYTFMQLKPNEMSENLNKNGGYIPGIRPGKETTEYVKTVLKRITIVGATFLTVLAILPIVFDKFSNLTTSISISGTGLLIVVGVALETYKQIESQLVSRTYVKGRKGRRR